MESTRTTIHVFPWGPDEETRASIERKLHSHPGLMEHLGERWRLLSLGFIPVRSGAKRDFHPPREYEACYYSYSHNHACVVTGPVDDPGRFQMEMAAVQPAPTNEEFKAAVQLIVDQHELGQAIMAGELTAFQPIPGVVEGEAGEHLERTLIIGLLPRGGGKHRLVHVNMVRGEVSEPKREANRMLEPASHCGVPNAGQSTPPRGTAGSFRMQIIQDGVTLWDFLVIRPAASSGTRGSGVELRDVRYRGKKVLYQAHAPILNVQYDYDACGPFRDWQWQESRFTAVGTDVAPGIRRCTEPPKTILESGSDFGNFAGVAIYDSGTDVRLVSELEAGWYRYVSEWRFRPDGTILPRFGFSAVENSCVCAVHNHHVYWRFDFDIVQAGGNQVWEVNDGNACVIDFETMRRRNPSTSRSWLVRDMTTCAGYRVLPGEHDGTADTYGRGDVWVLRYSASEIDDGNNSSHYNTEANLDRFLTGQPVNGYDVVLWYAAHFRHDVNEALVTSYLGPELRPAGW